MTAASTLELILKLRSEGRFEEANAALEQLKRQAEEVSEAGFKAGEALALWLFAWCVFGQTSPPVTKSAVNITGPWQPWAETNIVATEPQRFFRRTL